MDLDTVAQELYGLPLAEFTATRNTRAKQAKVAGDEGLARGIQGLAKPTTAAWLLNQLVRDQPEELTLLLDLGVELRAGMSGLDGDQLRLLTKQRYHLVSALARRTASLAPRRPGNDVAAEVQATLEATLSDSASAEAVRAGRLSHALHVSGFGHAETSDGVLAGQETAGRDADVVDMAAHRDRRNKSLEQARTRVETAKSALHTADARLAELDGRLRAMKQSREDTATEVRRLKELFEGATAQLAELDEQAAPMQRERQDAETAASRAGQDLDDARQALRRLDR